VFLCQVYKMKSYTIARYNAAFLVATLTAIAAGILAAIGGRGGGQDLKAAQVRTSNFASN
jgi:hypothetical protein